MADVNVIIGGTNVTLALSQDVGIRGPAGPAGGVVMSAGTNSTASGTVVLSNSNGVSFGMDSNGVVTASVAGAGGDFSASSNYQLTSDMTAYQQTSQMSNYAASYHAHQAGLERDEVTNLYPEITTGTGGDAGKVSVASAIAWFYDEADMDSLTMHTIAASGFLTMTDDVDNYICADRDTDSWVVINAVSSIDYIRYLPYFLVVKRAGSNNLHKQVIVLSAHGENEYTHQKNFACGRYQREEGSLLNLACADTTQAITLSGGGVWAVNYRYNIPAVSTATRQFKCVLNAGNWEYSTQLAPALVTSQYNGPNGMATLTGGFYAIMYVWRGIEDEDHLYTFYSTQEYASLELAQASTSLGTIPPLASGHAMFVGRIVFQQGATTNAGWICEGAFDTVFSASSAVTDHGSLLGLGDNDHPQYLMSNNASSVTASAMNTNERANYVLTANSSLFEHTSATSLITSNAMNTNERANYIPIGNSTAYQTSVLSNTFAQTSQVATSVLSTRFITAQTVQPAVGQLNGSSGTMSIAMGLVMSGSSNASTMTIGLATNWSTTLMPLGNSTAYQSSVLSNTFAQTSQVATSVLSTRFITAQTVQPAYVVAGTNSTGGGTSTGSGSTVSMINGNGVTFWVSNNSQINAAVVTSYSTGYSAKAESTHTHGNMSLALTNLNGTTASASNGMTLSLSVAAGGGGGATVNGSTGNVSITAGSASSGGSMSVNGSSITFGVATNYSTNWTNITNRAGLGTTFNGANISASMTHDTAGLQLSMSVAAPGAAAENNWVHLGGNTNGGSTASGSTIKWYGGNNITLQATNGSEVSILAGGGGGGAAISAGANSQNTGTVNFADGNGITFGLSNNGTMTASYNSTQFAGQGTTFGGTNISGSLTQNSNGIAMSMSVAAPGGGAAATVSGLEIFQIDDRTVYTTYGQNTVYMQKFKPIANVAFQNFEFYMSGSQVTSTNSQAVTHTYRYGLYSLDTNNSYQLIASSSVIFQCSINSNTAMGITVSQGAGSWTNTSGGTGNASYITGFRHLYLPFTSTVTAGGQYGIAILNSSATAVGTNAWRIGLMQKTNYNNLTIGKLYVSTGLASNTTHVGDNAMAVYATTSNALPNAMAKSQQTNIANLARMYVQLDW